MAKTPPKDATALDFLKDGVALQQEIVCPKCKVADFTARALQFEILRKCNKCGNEWSGGSVGVHPEYLTGARPGRTMNIAPPPLAEDDPTLDLPTYYGSPFRKFGGDE